MPIKCVLTSDMLMARLDLLTMWLMTRHKVTAVGQQTPASENNDSICGPILAKAGADRKRFGLVESKSACDSIVETIYSLAPCRTIPYTIHIYQFVCLPQYLHIVPILSRTTSPRHSACHFNEMRRRPKSCQKMFQQLLKVIIFC